MMSVLSNHNNMFNNHLNSFNSNHIRSRSYNELLNQFKKNITSTSPMSSTATAPNAACLAPPMSTGFHPSASLNSTLDPKSFYVKKRSYSDLIKESSHDLHSHAYDHVTKRSRTAPPSPPLESAHKSSFSSLPNLKVDSSRPRKSTRARSLSPSRKFINPISPSNSPNASPVATPVKAAATAAAATNDAIDANNYTTSSNLTSGIPTAPASKESSLSEPKITLPSIETALNSAPITPRAPIKLKPITPTVSLDYFDTYKPNDENWRYELLDSINRSSKHFNLNQYNYLNKHAFTPSNNNSRSINNTSYQNTNKFASSLPSSQSSSAYKPQFDSRISSKIRNHTSDTARPTLIPRMNHISERKINFPYESNYTYLNKTYMNDVKKYPEYLELAHSLIQLSQPQLEKQGDPQQSHYQQPAMASPQNHHVHPTHYSPSTHGFANTPLAMPFIAQPSHQQPNSMYHHPAQPTTAYPVLTSPSSTRLPSLQQMGTTSNSAYLNTIAETPNTPNKPTQHTFKTYQRPTPTQPPQTASLTKFIPVTPPSSKSKSRSDLIKSPPKQNSQYAQQQQHHHNPRVCISCGSDQSPCWRPSWSIKEGQLCNSCGLRYKKTSARCLNMDCKKIPAKGEWSLMQSKGKTQFGDGHEGYSCLDCGHRVEVKK